MWERTSIGSHRLHSAKERGEEVDQLRMIPLGTHTRTGNGVVRERRRDTRDKMNRNDESCPTLDTRIYTVDWFAISTFYWKQELPTNSCNKHKSNELANKNLVYRHLIQSKCLKDKSATLSEASVFERCSTTNKSSSSEKEILVKISPPHLHFFLSNFGTEVIMDIDLSTHQIGGIDMFSNKKVTSHTGQVLCHWVGSEWNCYFPSIVWKIVHVGMRFAPSRCKIMLKDWIGWMPNSII